MLLTMYINWKSVSFKLLNEETLYCLQDVVFKEGHITAGTLSGLIERLVPLPNYYPDVRFLSIINILFFFCFWFLLDCMIIGL